MDYGSFEGVLPKGEYGGGTVMLWDHGTWQPEGRPRKAYHNVKLKFFLEGQRLRGRWALVRMRTKDGSDRNWLLKKIDDEDARPATFATSVRASPRPDALLAASAGKRSAGAAFGVTTRCIPDTFSAA